MSILQVENLICGYKPKKPIINGVSFGVDEGDFVGIVGPNGSGKTTLLRAIIGLLAIQKGTVKVSNQPVDQLERREVARRIAFIPQMMEPVAGFTVEDLVLLGRTPYFGRFFFETEKDYEAVNWAIDELKIDKLRDRPVTKLSGGEFQRVAIARAVAQEPRVLLLDEPTTHLDLRFQVKICKLLWKLRRNRAVVSTFHDLNLASRHCSKLILMKKGEVIAEGLPNEVVTPDNIWKAYRIKAAVKKNPHTKKSKYVLLP
jgi:iron complex transport system ATP-binding protein